MGKHKEEWVRAIGEIVVPRLDKRLNRVFDFRQAGPYSGNSSVGIFFNDEDLRQIKRTKSTDNADFRFGFAFWTRFDAETEKYELRAGFQVSNKALARANFYPNLMESRSWVALRLQRWLTRNENSAYFWFEQQENDDYRWEPTDRLIDLDSRLSRYGDFDRKSTGKFADQPSNHRGAHFSIGRRLDELDLFKKDQLVDESARIAKTSLRVFRELGFLYDLLSREYAPNSPIAIEGQRIMAMRAHRKRERWMRDTKIADHKRNNGGRLPCDVCGFDFFQNFGEIGRDYAQVHHRNPLGATAKTSETRLEDLVVLCANCHAMAHIGQEVRTIDDLKSARNQAGIN